jgi:hypothetical protein
MITLPLLILELPFDLSLGSMDDDEQASVFNLTRKSNTSELPLFTAHKKGVN